MGNEPPGHDNVVRLHPRQTGPVEPDRANRGRDRQAETTRIKARADAIRTRAGATPKVASHQDRMILARNLGRLVYARMKERRRGWVTDLLFEHGIIKDRTESTKHLRRYAVPPGTDGKSLNPKTLGARLADYMRLSDAYATTEGLDPDEVLVKEVCSGVRSLEQEYRVELEADFEALAPLSRLLNAIADSVAADPRTGQLFRDHRRWQWESPNGAPDGRWTPYNHTQVARGEFLDVALIPKAELYTVQEKEYELYSQMVEDAEPSAPDNLYLRAYLSLWLVLAPSGPSEQIKPYLTWMWRTHVSTPPDEQSERTISVDGFGHHVPSPASEAENSFVICLDHPEYPCFFEGATVNEGLTHIDSITKPKNTTSKGLIDITPANLLDHLVNLLDPDHLEGYFANPDVNSRMFEGDTGNPVVSPQGTIACLIEGYIRAGGAEALRRELSDNMAYLLHRSTEQANTLLDGLEANEKAILEQLQQENNSSRAPDE